MPAIGSQGARGKVFAISAGGNSHSHDAEWDARAVRESQRELVGCAMHAAAAPHIEDIHHDQVVAGLQQLRRDVVDTRRLSRIRSPSAVR